MNEHKEKLRRVKAEDPVQDLREWLVSGEKGSVAFWVMKRRTPTFGSSLLGGLVYHSRTERADWSHRANCCYNKGPCWHNGSTLIAQDHWIANILPRGDEAIFKALIRRYHDWT